MEAFQALFAEVVELCREAGLVKLGRVVVDGRRVQGKAALDWNRTQKQIEKEVGRILEEAARIDAEEDAKYGRESLLHVLPKGFVRIRYYGFFANGTRGKELQERSLDQDRAKNSAYNGRGLWWNAGSRHMNQAVPDRTLSKRGLVSLLQLRRRLTCTS